MVHISSTLVRHTIETCAPEKLGERLDSVALNPEILVRVVHAPVDVFPSTASSPYPNAASLSESNLFDNGFMAPLQTSPPYANATGTSANTFDFSSLPPLEAISGDLCMPANGGYTSIETRQAMPEDANAASGGECFDSFANYVLDDAVWSPPHSTSGW